MGQALATLFWRWLGRDAARKPLLCDHNGDSQETGGDSFLFGRYWQLFRALIRRLLLGNNNPPSDPPPSLRYYAHTYPTTPTAREYCVDIGVVGDHIAQQPGIGNNEIGVARDDLVGQLAPVEPPISRQSDLPSRHDGGSEPGIQHCITPSAQQPGIGNNKIGVREKTGANPSTPLGPPLIGVARDDLVGKLAPPSVEPEISRPRWGTLGPYSWEHKILLVGEGDFSFSASLAVAFCDASNMIATSLDSSDFLMQNYARAVNNISELTSKNCKVMHGLDATKMAKHPQLNPLKFDRIVYNFPHAGFSNLHATKEDQIRKHQKLVRGFLRNAKEMIKDDGQIHITHKCVGFHLEWDIETLGSSQGLRLVEEQPFNLRDYPGYKTKYGFGGDKNFNWKPAKTYKFELAKKKPASVEIKSVSEVIAKAIGGREPQGNLSASKKQPKKLGSYMYNADQMMLLVGEGDFSFAASLAVAFGDASNLVATSLDSLEFLKKNYKKAESNILALTSRGCKVMYGVNATTMATKHPWLRSLKFDCIVFNFPWVVFSDPKPPRDARLSKHQGLIIAFLANAKQMIRGDGQIHITQCSGRHLELNIKTLGTSEGLQLVEESPFSSKDYPGYCSKLGCGGDQSFGCNPAVTYKFQLPSNNVPKLKEENAKKVIDVST